MIKPNSLYILLLLLCHTLAFAQLGFQTINKESFSTIDLTYPGLEEVNGYYQNREYEKAATTLLSYFRNRPLKSHPTFSSEELQRLKGRAMNKIDLQKADNALKHRFQPHKGYDFFHYGEDIDWQYWPVKDNEVRWQLHRVGWWESLGKAYQSTGDEKYAKEWIYQFRDWVRKNPKGLSEDNDRYAWRPLEVSDRVKSLPITFSLFIESPLFTPEFLMEFLRSYHEQASYIPAHYSAIGNHLLFEAERMVLAGCFFPEFRQASEWRQGGINVLNTEIKKQVFEDGVQFELSPTYHNAAIDIFLRALYTAQLAGLAQEFPTEYRKTVEKMIIATINFSFPDYSFPMFGDSWRADKKSTLQQYGFWRKSFPDNPVFAYFATEGREGSAPAYLSKALKDAGFYTFRNGWDSLSTVMVLKAGPQGFFHAQPDNGTFELWVKGRNFMPDAGCFVYSGNEEIMKMRDWYRQTKVHQTLTLNNQNMTTTEAKLLHWSASDSVDQLTYSNPSYPELSHQRTVLYIDKSFFLILDRAEGASTGQLDVHFQLAENGQPIIDKKKKRVYTQYGDGNNLLIQELIAAPSTLVTEEGKVSYRYREEVSRPAFAFQRTKEQNTEYFMTLIHPFDGMKPPTVKLLENDRQKQIVRVSVDKKVYNIIIKDK
ncbi:heparin-sulfate lyase HepC [Sphingobacterium deserti]|uniref:Heparinase II/III family protein n=1 Tax=Sphingobacterium deserti TaxID=1229276 RepID=A0A0B8T2U2_9SPHI|nr:heparin-sulfate lyase HepC [Sphingobacterium deserti]KGE13223.1 heparinase II/III family protein [Sphingobacterium deserti]